LAGDITRLMIFMPPQHGKSEGVSRRLPAYALGRNPDARVITCSYANTLAKAMNRDVQRIIDSPDYRELFPGTRLSGRSSASSVGQHYTRTSNLFEVVGRRGSYRSAGVGGGITGHGFDIGVVDDAIKGREQADSPTIRNKVWDWYTNEFFPRRAADARILVTATRWHRDDLPGRLLKQAKEPGAEQWTVLELPALRRSVVTHPDDPRKEGEALWPAFKSADELERQKKLDRHAFSALYQQDPSEAGGSEWPPSYFGPWIWCPAEKWPREFDMRVIAVDPSKGKQDKRHDYSAIVFIGIKDGLVYVDADLDRRPPDRIVRDTIRMCELYKPDFVGIEAVQFQEMLVPEFRRQVGTRFHLRIPVYAMQPAGVPKIVRIRRLGPYIVDREIRFKQDSPGCHLLVDQLLDFPNADHDDGPDALEMAVRLPVEIGEGIVV
jgi:predicted phage terminase large subunit-like protein